jgi:hypothetical protein
MKSTAGRAVDKANCYGDFSTAKPLTLEEIHRITWASLPSVKVGLVLFESKPLFEISGGDHRENRFARP